MNLTFGLLFLNPKQNHMNYFKLMQHEPSSYGTFTNQLGQEIEFFEHPIYGQDYPVVCVCHSLQLAALSDFYELDDMTAEHGEYAPSFQDGKFYTGEFTI